MALAGNPEYVPSQFVPGNYPNRVDISMYLGPGAYPGHSYTLLHTRGDDYGLGYTCRSGSTSCTIGSNQLIEQYAFGYIDGFDDGVFVGAVVGHEQGWADGQSAAIRIMDANGFLVYDGDFTPASYVKETFADRKGMRYGGIGLLAVGALIGLVWPDAGPAERLDLAPLPGGGRIGASFGF